MECVKEGKRWLVTLSPSSLSTWTCPLKGYLSYKLDLKRERQVSPSDVKALFGKALHIAIPTLRLTGDLNEAISRFDAVFLDTPEEVKTDWYSNARGRAILASYATKYFKEGKDDLKVCHIGDQPQVERDAKIPFIVKDDLIVTLQGIIDSVNYFEGTPKTLFNVDLKTTGSSIGLDDPWMQFQRISDQFTAYNAILHTLYSPFGYTVGGTILDCIYTRPKKLGLECFYRMRAEDSIKFSLKAVEVLKEKIEWTCRNIIIPVFEGTLRPFGAKSPLCLQFGKCKYLEACNLGDGDVDLIPMDYLNLRFGEEESE